MMDIHVTVKPLVLWLYWTIKVSLGSLQVLRRSKVNVPVITFVPTVSSTADWIYWLQLTKLVLEQGYDGPAVAGSLGLGSPNMKGSLATWPG